MDTTREGVRVQEGQVWHEQHPQGKGRIAKVLDCRDGLALMQTMPAGRAFHLRVAQMYRHTYGWVRP